MPCVDHLDFTDAVCPDCSLPVDGYGNTEDQFDYCSFPDCGCDGARLCMAKNGASKDSLECNGEGMYRGTDKASVKARVKTAGLCFPRMKKQKGGEG